jgi:ectoine hydroxylase-related dioxygenase (phytanoyl-CoA dioxygenase family)
MLNIQALQRLQKNGYVKLAQVVPPALLLRLRQQFNTVILNTENSEDVARHTLNGQLFTTNIDNICNKANLAALELMALPAILQAAEAVCGPDFFPIQDFAVIKMRGDNQPVLWHQDMMNRRSAPACTMGIYLDEAGENEGALRVIPGSHKSDRPVCELACEPSVVIPMQAGDVLIHDMLTAHCSGLLHKNEIRRVIYFEFLSPELVRAENIYAEALVKRRSLLLAAALKYYKEQQPEQAGFNWRNSHAAAYLAAGSVTHILKQVYSAPARARPSEYCFDAVVGD